MEEKIWLGVDDACLYVVFDNPVDAKDGVKGGHTWGQSDAVEVALSCPVVLPLTCTGPLTTTAVELALSCPVVLLLSINPPSSFRPVELLLNDTVLPVELCRTIPA